MKSSLLMLVAVLLPAAPGVVQAQTQPSTQAQSTQPQVHGRGRGGTPFAWNDKNKDGICDLTGRRVGQGRPAGFNRGVGRGRGRAWGDRDGDGICDFTGRAVGRGYYGGRGRGARAWGRGGAWRGTAPVQPGK